MLHLLNPLMKDPGFVALRPESHLAIQALVLALATREASMIGREFKSIGFPKPPFRPLGHEANRFRSASNS